VISHGERLGVLIQSTAVSETTKQRLLREATQLLGQHELAARLKVAESLLEAWISGDATMPDGKLLILAGVLDTWATATKPK
jgi:DNA-binding transcriptional regulator YiaG